VTVLDQFRLDGDVALVTGAAGGIGGALAEAMAEAGADVAVADIDEDVHAVADRLATETDAAIEPVVADVSEESEVEGMVDRTVGALGGLDVAFANAGVATRGGPAPEYDMDAWDELMDVNLRGVFLTARAAAAHMRDHGGGRIVTTASILGFNGTRMEGLAGYTAAKGGVVNLTRQLAGELAGDDIRVNAIAPGFIETAMTKEGLGEVDREALVSQIPAGRIGQPADLKGLAVYLASEASPYTTGETVLVDGGMDAV
jgi:NAD(P)-dependent dehydrogenase (short-subunit alcohol dehydrogenase family)